jgi:hypothetical protein
VLHALLSSPRQPSDRLVCRHRCRPCCHNLCPLPNKQACCSAFCGCPCTSSDGSRAQATLGASALSMLPLERHVNSSVANTSAGWYNRRSGKSRGLHAPDHASTATAADAPSAVPELHAAAHLPCKLPSGEVPLLLARHRTTASHSAAEWRGSCKCGANANSAPGGRSTSPGRSRLRRPAQTR